jgi:Zn finger protein HypA/HybF involved in hydrogenase expression
MHELGVAASILDTVQREAAPYAPAHAVKVGIRVGRLAGINCDALAFAFEALVQDSQLEPLDLVIEKGAADELEFRYVELEQDDTHPNGEESTDRERANRRSIAD